ncbi:hypothetical protein MTR_4g026370 [Medicago truncatula]|uniref:Uncharacterized protein n=1 Tax=Medicago truncatula TaxID=3880 RepID=G7JFW2_MEDTR|nr:hypothetical protein MTR_4g026370 [Medicago truncatula]
MDIMQAFTTGLKSDSRMLLNAYARGTMKIKTSNEVRELIDNMSLSEYRAHTEEKAATKKKGMIDLNTHDVYFLVTNFSTFNSKLWQRGWKLVRLANYLQK